MHVTLWTMLLIPAISGCPALADGFWDGRFFLSGINGEVRAIASSGNDTYVGGQFTSADNIALTNVAKWTGTNWAALGSGVNGAVNAIAVRAGTLYVGGVFTSAGAVAANRVACWDGTNWSALGSGIAGARVTALAVDVMGALYVGGEFTNASGVAVANIAKWDGTNWSALGSGLRNDPYAAWVLALAVRGSDLFAGGFFTDAGGVSVSCIARWNGATWASLSSGVDDRDYLPQVTALAVNGNDLYVGGAFTLAGNSSAAHVAKWNGSVWSALGGGLTRFFGDIPVATLAVSGGDLLVAGRFQMAGGNSANNLARWNGITWSEFGGGATGTIKAIAASTSTVHVAGSFTVTDSSRPNGLASWNGATWSNVSAAGGLGLSGPPTLVENVSALSASGSSIYVAGTFSSAGERNIRNIARWDGTNWWPLGLGIEGLVFALVWSDSSLFAGGDFDSAGGVPATNIARWNGMTWSPVGAGVAGPVYALTANGNELYAAGAFTSAGGIVASNIARWNGTAWASLGSGVNGPVYALAATSNVLFAGGKFTLAGGANATNLARWSDSQWFALGGGIGGVANAVVRIRPPPVSALVLSGSNLYVGGDFAWAGGVAATNIARWDGADWHALSGSVIGVSAFAPPPAVAAMLVSGEELIIGGSFTRAGGQSARNIAKYDGSSWSALGDVVGADVNSLASIRALALSERSLYAGGHFKSAGGKPASHFSIWHLPMLLQIHRQSGSLRIHWPIAAQPYILETSKSLSEAGWQSVTNVPVFDGAEAAMTITPLGPGQFHRLRRP